MQTHTDKIWISEPREKQTVKTLVEHVQACGYTIQYRIATKTLDIHMCLQKTIKHLHVDWWI